MKQNANPTERELKVLKYRFSMALHEPLTWEGLPPSEAELLDVDTRFVDGRRGGLQTHCLTFIRAHDPELYAQAWRAKDQFWRNRKQAGEVSLVILTGIPSQATWADCFAALPLKGVDFHLSLRRNRETGDQYAELYVHNSVAEQLVKTPPSINGVQLQATISKVN